MAKQFFLFIITCCITSITLGQSLIKGRVFEDKTRITLADIQVENSTTKQHTTTDDKGRFSIYAKSGDVLIVKGFAYEPDTVLITNTRALEVFLIPHQNFLNEVKVLGDSTNNLNTYYDPMFHGQTMVYQRDADMRPTGGVVFRLRYWKKDERRRAHLKQEVKEQQQQDILNQVFRPANIGKYVPLKGSEMIDFLAMYTPSIKVYFANDFNLLAYLNTCYQKYQALPPDKRHPDKLEN